MFLPSRRNALTKVFALIGVTLLLPASPARGAFPTAVPSIADATVAAANVKVLGDEPSVVMSNLLSSVSQAMSKATLNATNTQQIANLTSQAVTTQGVNTLYSIDTASAAMFGLKQFGAANVPRQLPNIPAEGFLSGVTALAFDNDGVLDGEPDFWVIADQGFDFFRSTAGNLILEPVRLRNFGNAPSPILELTIGITPEAVAEFFPDLFDPLVVSPSSNDPIGPASAFPYDYYFGVRDANGDFAYFAADLLAPGMAVPEPSAMFLMIAALWALGSRCQVLKTAKAATALPSHEAKG